MKVKVILQESEVAIKEKKSSFIGLTFFVHNENEVKDKLELCKQKYPNAAHYCYAYLIDKNTQRASDAREPSGSAGLPILRKIMSSKLERILVVVVRYYGGVKLGVPGLIAAYGATAEAVLKSSGETELDQTHKLKLSYAFTDERAITTMIRKLNLKIVHKQADERMHLTLEVNEVQHKILVDLCAENRNFTVHEI